MDLNFESARLKARKHLEIALRNPTSVAYSVAGWMARFRRRFDEALSFAESAVTLDPNEPDAHFTMARVLLSRGKPREALGFIIKAMQLDPYNMAQTLHLSARAHFYMGELNKAAILIERAIVFNSEVGEYYDDQAQIYALLGREQDARRAVYRQIY